MSMFFLRFVCFHVPPYSVNPVCNFVDSGASLNIVLKFIHHSSSAWNTKEKVAILHKLLSSLMWELISTPF
jgi:hypothetical protein